MVHALRIFLRDMKDLFRDMSLLILVLMPLALGGGLFYLLPDETVNVGYIDDKPFFLSDKPSFNLREYTSEDEMRQALGREIAVGIILQQNNSQGLAEKITLMESNENSLMGDVILMMYLSAVTEPPETEVLRTAREASQTVGARTQVFTMSILMGMILIGTFLVPTLIVEEKEKGTLRALVTSGVGFSSMILSKAMTGFLVSTVVGLLIALLTGMEFGSMGVFLLFLALGAVFSTLVGLITGGYADNIKDMNSVATLFMLALLLPSILNNLSIPRWLDRAIMVLPTYWIQKGIFSSLASSADAGEQVLALVIVAVANIAFFATAVYVLKKASQRIA